MGIITSIWEVVSDVITGFFTSLGKSFEGMIGLLYNTTSSTLTTAGILLAMGLGFSIAWFGVRFIVGLVRMRRNG